MALPVASTIRFVTPDSGKDDVPQLPARPDRFVRTSYLGKCYESSISIPVESFGVCEL